MTVKKKKSINLYTQFSDVRTKNLKRQKILLMVAPALIVVIVLVGIYMYLRLETSTLKSDIENLKRDLKILEIEEKRTTELQFENITLTNDLDSLKQMKELSKEIASKNSSFEVSLFKKIELSGGSKINIDGCAFADNALTLTLKTTNNQPLNISSYVKSLRQLKRADGKTYFNKITYTGYSGGTGYDYTFTVTCTFSD